MQIRFTIRRRGFASALCFLLAWSAIVVGGEAAKDETPIKVSHAPKQPKSGERVVITVETQRPLKTESLVLQYQVVDPGNYIDLRAPAYATDWKEAALSSAVRATSAASRTAFKAELPPELQTNRRLIRYRIFSTESKAVVAPDAKDTQPNFAYFVYDGIPEWRGAVNPKGTGPEKKVVTFDQKVMRSLQAYHLIAERRAVENVTWHDPKGFMNPAGSEYEYTGTLVAEGAVYDHVRFRARGGQWRHATGKNMWKIDFLKGHRLEARDNWGRKYPKKWDKLNLSGCIQQADYGMRGEQGMLDAVSFRLFNLAGVEAPHTHWVQFRIVDAPEETPDDQYRGDFWGLYLAIENVDDQFIETHDLPDGNLYKMDFNGPEPKHLAADAPDDRADVLQFMRDLRRNPNVDWWRTHVDLPRYYSYRSILESVHHYDIMMGKNYYYFRPTATKRWQVIPWDVDLTWSDRAYGNGEEPFKQAGLLRCEPLTAEYQSRLIEIRDLLFNAEQTGALIDEYAAVIGDLNGGRSFVEADRAKWDFHPIMSSRYIRPGKSGPGYFYGNSPTGDFRGMAQLMKQYVAHRGEWIDRTLLADASIPATPVIAPAGPLDASAPSWKLRLARPAAAQKVKWRLAEITDTKNPPNPTRLPGKYEIDALWQAEGGAVGDIPTRRLEKGHTYRIRARVQNGAGSWSHWSAPEQITVR